MKITMSRKIQNDESRKSSLEALTFIKFQKISHKTNMCINHKLIIKKLTQYDPCLSAHRNHRLRKRVDFRLPLLLSCIAYVAYDGTGVAARCVSTRGRG